MLDTATLPRSGLIVEQWDLWEHALAWAGYAIVSAEIAAIIVRIEAGLPVAECEVEATLYAIYAGPYGDYHHAPAWA